MKIGVLDIGQAVRHADGFAVGGDRIIVTPLDSGVRLIVADVLGHGPDAHALALQIEQLAAERPTCDVMSDMAHLDRHLRGSLGAAVGIAFVDSAGRGVYTGVGNTVARIFGEVERRLHSVDGVVGQSGRAGRETPFRLGAHDVLLLHTDGVTSRFTLDAYPQMLGEDPEAAAAEILRRFGRTSDDAACAVVRLHP